MSTSIRRPSMSTETIPDDQRLARRQGDHPLHDPDLGLAVDHATALEIARPELALLERRRLVDRHSQLATTQRLGLVARAAALDAQDRLLGRARAARQRDAAAAQQQLLAVGEQRRVGAYDVEGAVEPVRPADVAGQELIRRCRRGRGGCP
jgi:hypothetical protein